MFAIVFAASFGGMLGATALPTPVSAACNSGGFLTLPAWYRGLTNDDCSLKSPADMSGPENDRLGKYIWTIVLNVIEMALHVVGYIAVGMIIYGGFRLMTSEGEPANIESARKTIRDAIVGLVISMAAIAIVNLVAGGLGLLG